MADPFSIFAGAVGVTDVAAKTSSTLRKLISEFRNAPALVQALFNEITEISVVLERVKESQRAVRSLGDLQHDDAFLAALDGQLNKARNILTDMESLVNTLRAGNSRTRGFRWLRKKEHATDLKVRLKAVRVRVNELLLAHNPSLESRIMLKLDGVQFGVDQTQASTQTAIQTANSNFQATSNELIAIRNTMAQQKTVVNSGMQTVQDIVSVHTVEATGHRRQVTDQLSTIHNTTYAASQTLGHMLADQAKQFNAIQTVQLAMLSELAAASSQSVATKRPSPTIQPISSCENLNSAVFFSLRLPGSHCDNACPCRCHLPARPNTSLRLPLMLRAALGYLFLGYTGYPSSPARCNIQYCAKGSYVRFQASYCFPLWLCLRYVLQASMEASMSGIFTFRIVARRIMPWQPGHILYETQNGTVETVANLLRNEKWHIQDVTADGESVLHYALKSRNPRIEIMKMLLQNGADPDLESDRGLSFRTLASDYIVTRSYSPDYVRGLEGLLPGSNHEELELSYLHKVVLGILPISLSQILQTPVAYMLNGKTRTGRTPLMYAALQGDGETVRALVDAGAEVNEVSVEGGTALHLAVPSGSPVCVDALLQAGADLNALDVNRNTPLHLAAGGNHITIGRRLVDAGANIKAQNADREMPMICAAYGNAVDMIHCLYHAGASLESTDHRWRTPLCVAVWKNAKEAAILLLRLGANAAYVGSDRWTLLHYVAWFSSLGMTRALASVDARGPDATARDIDGWTAQEILEWRESGSDSEKRAAFVELTRRWCRSAEANSIETDYGICDNNRSDDEFFWPRRRRACR
ncbi:hypothetical protein F5Y10DRAFT_109399 [Nemania abortiva]|nr:hypothetical protein F5Y10DRAFT_109399 [Nemania abortiva]